jgi:hypothetical protein
MAARDALFSRPVELPRIPDTWRKHLKRALVGACLTAASLAAMGGTALAGEVTGSDHGGPNKNGVTPINAYQAGSICSFSGLNDDPSGGGDPFQDGKVQNWGKVVEDAKAFIGDGDHGANEVARLFQTEGPGTNCRGYASGD